MSERAIQNSIRNDLAGRCHAFRANVGKAWTGSAFIRQPNGDLLIKDPRPFDTGLPTGFSDLFGIKQTLITEEMVGQHVGQFFALEIKDVKGRMSPAQEKFLAAVERANGVAGVARSVDDARRVLGLKS